MMWYERKIREKTGAGAHKGIRLSHMYEGNHSREKHGGLGKIGKESGDFYNAYI